MPDLKGQDVKCTITAARLQNSSELFCDNLQCYHFKDVFLPKCYQF